MRTRMKLDIISTNDEEKDIEKFLTLLHCSKEINDFFKIMEELANRRNAYICTHRIKEIKSAIRTYRINQKTLKDAHDYIGVWFIMEDEKDIIPVIDDIKARFPDAEYLDFTSEDSVYSPLIYDKWVPPLNYTILAKETLIPNQRNVPIEIRITWKESYIADQAAYFSIHKNDKIMLPIEEKKELKNIVQILMYKLALLICKDYNTNEQEKQMNDFEKIIEVNYHFLKDNHNLLVEATNIFGRTLYKYEHYYEMLSDENTLSQNSVDDIDDYLMKSFSKYIKIADGDYVSRVRFAIHKLRNMEYLEIKRILSI